MGELDRDDEWYERRREVAERAAERRRQRHILMGALQRERRAEEEDQSPKWSPSSQKPAQRPPKPVDPEAVRAGCSYPHNTGSTAYSKGCRCRRCKAWKGSQPKQPPRTEYQREWKRKQRQTAEGKAKQAAANRRYYERNKERLKADAREYRRRKKAERDQG